MRQPTLHMRPDFVFQIFLDVEKKVSDFQKKTTIVIVKK